MVSHNKEVDQTVKTQHFPIDKTLTGLPSNANIDFSFDKKKTPKANQKGADYDCIVPILDIVETRDIILSNNKCDVHGYAC